MEGIVLSGRSGLKKTMKLENGETGREIIMIGMIHLEKEAFFDEIRTYLDSLKREGYVVFYEGIDEEGIDSLSLDTLQRKFRRVVGLHLTGYNDERNESLPRMFKSERYVTQTRTNLGLTTEQDIRADFSLDHLIAEFEKKEKEIVLTDCDWNTGLMEKYKPNDKTKYNKYYMIHTLRNDHVKKMVEESEHSKIVILYGRAHWYALYAGIRDMGFKIVEGKL